MESMSSEMKAPRQFKRKSYGQIVLFYIDGTEHRGYSADLSAGGMFIQTIRVFPVGSAITLKLVRGLRKKETVLHGKITRTTKEGIGVEFMR